MATAKLTPLSSQPQPTITSEQICRYTELAALVTQLEAQLRAPNPAFAAGLRKPAETVRIPLNLDGSQTAVISGD